MSQLSVRNRAPISLNNKLEQKISAMLRQQVRQA